MEKRQKIRLLCVFTVVGCRCALCSSAWWFFSEIWKLLAISKSPAAFCGVFPALSDRLRHVSCVFVAFNGFF